MIFDATLDTAHVNQFFPCEFIVSIKSIQVKQVNLATSLLTLSLRDLIEAGFARLYKIMRGQLVASLPFTLHGRTNNTVRSHFEKLIFFPH